VGLALAALAPPLVVFPFEVCTFRSRSALPRRFLSWASLGASNRSALRLHDPSASQRALQSFREPEGRLGLRRVSLRGVLADTGSHLAAGGPCLAPRGGQARRPISTGQLSALPRVHLPPINLVVFQGPSGRH
jgi:hypothetical protein